MQILVELCLSDPVRVAFDVGVSSFSQVLVHHVFVLPGAPWLARLRSKSRGGRRAGALHVQKRSDLVGLRFPRSIDRNRSRYWRAKALFKSSALAKPWLRSAG
jgi:hypothetical protein